MSKDIEFGMYDFEPGIVTLKQMEEGYGRKFTSEEIETLTETMYDWLPYHTYSISDLCDDWSYEDIRYSLNMVLFPESDDFSKTYNSNGEEV